MESLEYHEVLGVGMASHVGTFAFCVSVLDKAHYFAVIRVLKVPCVSVNSPL